MTHREPYMLILCVALAMASLPVQTATAFELSESDEALDDAAGAAGAVIRRKTEEPSPIEQMATLFPPANAQEEPSASNSLFFSGKELALIRTAIQSYQNQVGFSGSIGEGEQEDELKGLKPDEVAKKYFTYPQLYLESLVYHSPNDWVVWINGQKILPTTPKQGADIQVEAIDRDKVTIVWRPVDMEKINEVWDISPTESVSVDDAQGTVTFTLRHNQTFSSYVMRVLEGKVVPVTVELQHARGAKPKKEPQAAPEAASAESGEDADNTGLGGLINSYKKLESQD